MKVSWVWVLLILILFAVRIQNILSLPLYLDEGVYLFWASLFKQDPSFAYISLQDGKTPLFIWLIAYLQPFFNNFLLTGRFISIAGGVISTISWLILLRIIFDKKVSFWFWVILITLPFANFIERIAFMDSLLLAFGSLSLLLLYLSKREIESKKTWWKIAFLSISLGIVLALAFFTKTSAKIFLLAEILIVVCWVSENIIKKKLLNSLLICISLTVALLIYHELVADMRIGAFRFWEMINIKEDQLVFTPKGMLTLLKNNPGFYISHLQFLAQYLFFYLGGVILLLITGAYSLIKKQSSLWLILYLIVLTLGILMSGKVIASRYFYILVPPIVGLAALGAKLIWSHSLKMKLLVIIILIINLYLSSLMIFSPLKAFYSSDDQGYFISGELSALGLNEVIDYLKPNASKTIIGVSGTWGVKEGSQVLFKNAGIEAIDISNIVIKLPKEINCATNQIESEKACVQWNADSISQSSKPFKYFYLTGKYYDLPLFQKLHNFTIENEFTRPYSNFKVYLLKLN